MRFRPQVCPALSRGVRVPVQSALRPARHHPQTGLRGAANPADAGAAAQVTLGLSGNQENIFVPVLLQMMSIALASLTGSPSTSQRAYLKLAIDWHASTANAPKERHTSRKRLLAMYLVGGDETLKLVRDVAGQRHRLPRLPTLRAVQDRLEEQGLARFRDQVVVLVPTRLVDVHHSRRRFAVRYGLPKIEEFRAPRCTMPAFLRFVPLSLRLRRYGPLAAEINDTFNTRRREFGHDICRGNHGFP